MSLVVLLGVLLSGLGAAQVIGPNIDIIQEHEANPSQPCVPPLCDRLNKQVETEIAASPQNAALAVVVFNDYRLSLSSGQAWCGWAQTRNAGHTWKNAVFPIDVFPRVDARLPQNFCTDPVVVWDVFGAAYTVLLAGVRGDETQVFAVKLKEPDGVAGGDLAIDRAVRVDLGQNFTGTGLDKPSVAYTPPSLQYPRGIIHVVYAIFDGAADRTKVMYARSTDGGITYSRPIKLNNTLRQNNNTTTVVGSDGAVYVFWTVFDPTQRGVVVVKSMDGGLNFSTPTYLSGAETQFFPYHQPGYSTTDNFISDRSLAIPAVAVAGPPAGQTGPDRLIVAWQEYAGADGRPAAPVLNSATGKFSASPRIVITASHDGGQSWTAGMRRAAEVGPEDAYQIKPRLVVAGGVATLLFEDARNGGCEFKLAPLGLPLMTGITCKRTLRVLQADLAAWSSGLPSWSSTSAVVTQFPKKDGAQVQRQPNCGPAGCPAVYEPNHLNAVGGTQAFTGDYNGLAAAQALVRDAVTAVWRLPIKSTDPRTVYAAWADNRWGKVPTGYPANLSAWQNYNGGCTNPGTRNIKPFFAQISPGLVATWRGTDKQLLLGGIPQQPEIVMVVQNLTDTDRMVRFRIDPLSNGNWSFSDKVDLDEFVTSIGRFSSVSRILVRRGIAGDPTIAAASLRALAEEIGPQGLSAEINFRMSNLAVPVSGPVHSFNLSQLSSSDVRCLSKSSPQCSSANPGSGFNSKTQVSAFGFDTFGFDTFGFDTFGFDTFGFDTFGFDTGAVPDRDATWTVQGSGASTTPVNALTLLGNGAELLSAGFDFQLLFYTTHWVPVDVDPANCAVRSLPLDVPLSNVRITSANSKQIGSFGFDTFGFDTFGFDTGSPSEQITNASMPVGGGEKVKVTLRAYRPQGTPDFDPLSAASGASQAAVGQVLASGSTTEYVADFDDRTPPVILPQVTPAPNADGWNKTDVTVSWSVTDPGSGIGSATLTSSDPAVAVPPHTVTCPTVTISTETAGITLTCAATNRAGRSATPVSVTVKIDKTAPVVTITSPVNGTAYLVGTAVTANYACSDSLSGVATCDGPVANGGSVDTSTIGPRTFTVNASDRAGNAGATSVTYYVTYQFTGFFSPLGAAGTSWGTLNLGKAVPIKYRLNGAGGVVITAVSSLTSLKAVQVNTATGGTCPVTAPAVPLRTITLYNPTRGATGGSTFRFDRTNQQFIFNWDTSKGDDVSPLPLTGGCYVLLTQFDDGAPPKSGSLLLK